jgi:flagellar biosynthesis chaperone FliJ
MTQYPLHSVLELRRREEEGAAARLADAMQGRIAAEAEEQRMAAEVVAARARLSGAHQFPTILETAGSALTAARFTERLRHDLKAAEARLASHRAQTLAGARLREAAARDEHLAARRARRALEKHAARHAASVRQASERREEVAQDDRGRGNGPAAGNRADDR